MRLTRRSFLPLLGSLLLAQYSSGLERLLSNPELFHDKEMRERFSLAPTQPTLLLLGYRQQLFLMREGVVRGYDVSTGSGGFGNERGECKTPIGVHQVWKKFGAGEPLVRKDGRLYGTAFQARVPVGQREIYTEPINLPRSQEAIMTRILWLNGVDPENRNNWDRYIYIHGTNEEGLIGQPASQGCIRMRNKDIIELYRQVPVGTYINIVP
ncbi:L,D-transpeptidase [Candidatus Parcubacteria bacterium]|nr:MAG: L,D-transpeptidase [Candidatus Parcubacteria bacterium]